MMGNDAYKNLSKQCCPRFGKIAIDKGFITETQLKKALVEQVEDDISNKPHRLIGSILFENGWITNKQIIIVLDILAIENRFKQEVTTK